MKYFRLGFAGLMMLCFGIPSFFISATDINGGHFQMNVVAWICLSIDIIGALICGISYFQADQEIKQQSKPEVEHE